VSTTNLLLAIILFILLKQFYPAAIEALAPRVIVVVVLYGCYWLVAKLPGKLKKRTAEKRLEQEDENAFWEHQKRHEGIRAKYDPKHEWNEATSLPNEYLKELRQLNLKYREMLQRRNGWTAKDFQ